MGCTLLSKLSDRADAAKYIVTVILPCSTHTGGRPLMLLSALFQPMTIICQPSAILIVLVTNPQQPLPALPAQAVTTSAVFTEPSRQTNAMGTAVCAYNERWNAGPQWSYLQERLGFMCPSVSGDD